MIANYASRVQNEACACASCLECEDGNLFSDTIYINQRLGFSNEIAAKHVPAKAFDWLLVSERERNASRTFGNEQSLTSCIPMGLSRIEEEWLASLA